MLPCILVNKDFHKLLNIDNNSSHCAVVTWPKIRLIV